MVRVRGNGKDQKWVTGLGMSHEHGSGKVDKRTLKRKPWTDHRVLVEPVDLAFRWADYKTQRVYYPPTDTWVLLEPKEADLLAIFMINRGRAINSEGIIERLYPDPDLEPEWAKSSVTQYVYRLRKKVPGVIMTVGWGMGYVIPLPQESFMVSYVRAQDRKVVQEPMGFHKSYNRKYTPMTRK